MSIYSMAAGTTEVALTAATTKTVVQLRGATSTRARIIAWGVSFDGVTPGNDPVTVRLLRQTTDGTLTAGTEVPLDPVDPAAGVTGFHTATAEPTAGDVLEVHLVHPQGGLLIREYPPGREPVIDDATTSRLGIDCNAPQAVNVAAWIQWEE